MWIDARAWIAQWVFQLATWIDPEANWREGEDYLRGCDVGFGAWREADPDGFHAWNMAEQP